MSKLETKKLGKLVRVHLRNYFSPMHKHLGFENAKSIHQIHEYIKKKCGLNGVHEKNCKYFSAWITQYIQTRMRTSILNPKSKYYLRGLLCETVKRVGYYYFIKSQDEQGRIKDIVAKEIKGRQVMAHKKIVIDGSKHLQQIEYKED